MAKLVTKQHTTLPCYTNLTCPQKPLNVLADQLRRAIISQYLPKLCLSCRSLFLEKSKGRSTLPPLTFFCLKCRNTLLALVQPSKKSSDSNNSHSVKKAKSKSNSIADRFLSFFSSIYSGLCSSSPVQSIDEAKKEVALTGIVTRNRIDSTSVYPYLTALSRPWCRYCGVTVSSKWKVGPWGETSLCNSHGPDEAGNVQFDLHHFSSEGASRLKPILSEYCICCWHRIMDTAPHSTCNGCSLAVHSYCASSKTPNAQTLDGLWYCSPECVSDRKKRIVRSKIGFDERMPYTINPVAQSPERSPKPQIIADISVPRFVRVTPIKPITNSCSMEVENELEDMNDDRCDKRHRKFERTEKVNNLLRPHILKRLFPKKAAK
jgi:hypothetical protein